MIIRGRVITDETWIKIWMVCSTASMAVIYSSFYYYTWYYVENNPKVYHDEYFMNIQNRCSGVTFSDESYFFYKHSNLNCGLIAVYLGVYLGALMRHMDHGMVRRDYSHLDT